jgi:hypothetical protein
MPNENPDKKAALDFLDSPILNESLATSGILADDFSALLESVMDRRSKSVEVATKPGEFKPPKAKEIVGQEAFLQLKQLSDGFDHMLKNTHQSLTKQIIDIAEEVERLSDACVGPVTKGDEWNTDGAMELLVGTRSTNRLLPFLRFKEKVDDVKGSIEILDQSIKDTREHIMWMSNALSNSEKNTKLNLDTQSKIKQFDAIVEGRANLRRAELQFLENLLDLDISVKSRRGPYTRSVRGGFQRDWVNAINKVGGKMDDDRNFSPLTADHTWAYELVELLADMGLTMRKIAVAEHDLLYASGSEQVGPLNDAARWVLFALRRVDEIFWPDNVQIGSKYNLTYAEVCFMAYKERARSCRTNGLKKPDNDANEKFIEAVKKPAVSQDAFGRRIEAAIGLSPLDIGADRTSARIESAPIERAKQIVKDYGRVAVKRGGPTAAQERAARLLLQGE